jgi:predicted amidohydrolase
MKITVAQVKIVPEKKKMASNHDRLMKVLDQIAPHEPTVTVTGECYLDGYAVTENGITRDGLMNYAVDPGESHYTRAISDWSRSTGSWTIYGCTRATEKGPCNSALVYNASGKYLGAYDKVQCQNHDHLFIAGKSLPVWKSDFGLFGVVICADRRWPETVRTLALKGARVIFNPTYGMHDVLNLHMMETRAFESEVFMVFTHPVQSIITDPRGRVVVNNSDDTTTYTITEIDLEDADRQRSRPMSHLKDCRPDIYFK